MAELPRTIAGWSSPLAILKEELSEALGSWMPAIAGLVGPMRKRDRTGRVTVDGVSGLSRRGSYERLLVSEWAIAKAAPLEFLRRAASTEHLFTDLDRREPAGSQRSVILVDVGPAQLGAPRIVQLAALIVLGRRAALADAAVAWGTLQRASHPAWDAVDQAALKHMLRHRSPKAATKANLQGWLEATGFPQDGDELWLIGDEALRRIAPAGAHLLTIQDADHPDGAVTMTVSRAGTGGGRRSVSLPLPEARLQPLLLKQPFRPKPPPGKPQLDAPAGVIDGLKPSFRFSHSGSRLLAVEQRTGAYLSIRLARNQRSLRVDRVPVQDGAEVVGMGYHQGHYALFRQDAARLTLSSTRHREEALDVGPALATLMDPAAPTPVHRLRYRDRRRTRFLVGQQLCDFDHNTKETTVVASRCLASWMRDGHACIIGDTGDGMAIARYLPDGTRDLFAPLKVDATEAHVGFQRGSMLGLMVVHTADGLWQVVGQASSETLKAPRNAVVLGCMGIGARGNRPALLVCSGDGSTLALVRSDMSQAMPTELGRVVFAAASDSRPEVAWMTDDGTLTVWDVAREQQVAQLTAEARK